MEASIANMRKHYRDGVNAYSPATGEEYSANPGDYWNAPSDWVMRDRDGVPMVLGTFARVFTPLTDQEV